MLYAWWTCQIEGPPRIGVEKMVRITLIRVAGGGGWPTQPAAGGHFFGFFGFFGNVASEGGGSTGSSVSEGSACAGS